jgi:hypothetical protein
MEEANDSPDRRDAMNCPQMSNVLLHRLLLERLRLIDRALSMLNLSKPAVASDRYWILETAIDDLGQLIERNGPL